MWSTHRRQKGAEIVKQAAPYGAGPWLELGSGSGNNTLPLSKTVDSVIALDRNSRELWELQQKISQIYPLQADFRVLPFRAGILGGVFTSFSLHFVEEHALVLHEVARILRPKGTLVLVEYQTSESVPWIPFPLPKNRAFELLRREEFHSIGLPHETQRYYILKCQKQAF
ncbi:MAG: class I SAM-dependent methyltransferase [Candidatus Hodarchaeota archaeon]